MSLACLFLGDGCDEGNTNMCLALYGDGCFDVVCGACATKEIWGGGVVHHRLSAAVPRDYLGQNSEFTLCDRCGQCSSEDDDTCRSVGKPSRMFLGVSAEGTSQITCEPCLLNGDCADGLTLYEVKDVARRT